MSIIRCKFPQLAVVKGLVVDKRQKLESGTSLLTHRVARRSYGVLCREPWNPNIHIGEDVVMDTFIPGMRWANNQIDWIIRKVLPSGYYGCRYPLMNCGRAIQWWWTPIGSDHSQGS
jgi:hypothetical protein